MLSALKYIDWLCPATVPKTEAVIGLSDFQNPYFLKKGWEKSRAVGLIPGFGTAFLINKTTIMTNWHVFRRDDWAKGQNIAFDVELGDDGLPMTPVRYTIRPDILFYSNENLDFCVVAVDGNPGETRGFIDVRKLAKIKNDSRANIIQHPAGGLKQIAIRDNGISYFDSNKIQYWTDTEHGSSGSPVFDDNWEIIGLHYQHDSAPNEFGENINFNEAHTIESIMINIDSVPEVAGKI
jgi:V8-like Glu-specific endopeptidase